MGGATRIAACCQPILPDILVGRLLTREFKREPENKTAQDD